MHFLCSTFGSSGDVFPLLGLALRLRGRGHDVTLATNPHFEEVCRRHGLPFEPLGTKQLYTDCINNPDLWHPRRSFKHIFQSFEPVLHQQYDLHAAYAARHAAISIANCLSFGARLAQDKLGVPLITVHLQPGVLWSDTQPPTIPGMFGPRWLRSLQYRIAERFIIDPIVCPLINRWRRDLDLPPIRQTTRWWNSPYAVLCLFPAWFGPPQPDWPGNLIQTDFPLWNDQRNDQSAAGLSPDIAAYLSGGDPPLVFTPGSANVHGRPFFEAAIEACRLLGRRGILLTEFPDQVPQPLPGNVAWFRYVPLDLLLPRASAFVHHGGVGSTSQGMAAGIPQLIMPLAHDQFDNAERLRRLELGDALKPASFTGTRVAEKLRRLLGSPAKAAACRTISQRLAARDGLTQAATAIESRVASFDRPAPT